MVSNTGMLLGQFWLRPRCVHTYHPIVTKDIRWYIDCNPKHAHIVAQCLYYLHWIIHHGKLWSKRWCLNWVLSLAEPDYWRTVAKQKYASLRSSRLSFTSMTCVNKTIRQHEFASCKLHITWGCLLSITIKLRPVTPMEPVFVDGRMCRVETQIPLRMRLKISKDMEFLIKVTGLGHHRVAW